VSGHHTEFLSRNHHAEIMSLITTLAELSESPRRISESESLRRIHESESPKKSSHESNTLELHASNAHTSLSDEHEELFILMNQFIAIILSLIVLLLLLPHVLKT
jgi:hypothetical protein